MLVDPTSPNIMQFRSGAAVSAKLARPFFVELQSRYGNLFYVREEVGFCRVQLLMHLGSSLELSGSSAGRVRGGAQCSGRPGGVLGAAAGLCGCTRAAAEPVRPGLLCSPDLTVHVPQASDGIRMCAGTS